MVIDPYKNKQAYESWVKQGMPLEAGSEANNQIIRQYLKDLELGINVAVSSKKGKRSYIRLLNVRYRLQHIGRQLKQYEGATEFTKLTERQIHQYFWKMREGQILKSNGEKYKRVRNYVKIFKSFWHWHQRVMKKQGIEILDITTDLDTSTDKPSFVYFTIEQLKEMMNKANFDYRVLMIFLFDTGIRAPKELMNIKVSDIKQDDKGIFWLNIREEISKTFQRKIKLMLCPDLLMQYIKEKQMKEDDYIFTKNPKVVNRYLGLLAYKILKVGNLKEVSGGKDRIKRYVSKGLSLYDFRHSSCCYWLPRYKSESALKYRFGWKRSEMIHYYSEFLGMKDTIQMEDLEIDFAKTEIQKELDKHKQEKSLMEDELSVLRNEVAELKSMFIKAMDKAYHQDIKQINEHSNC